MGLSISIIFFLSNDTLIALLPVTKVIPPILIGLEIIIKYFKKKIRHEELVSFINIMLIGVTSASFVFIDFQIDNTEKNVNSMAVEYCIQSDTFS